MSTLVHAVFENAPSAHEAVDDRSYVNHDGTPLSGEVHEGHLREEEVPLPGTAALRGAVAGGLVVGVVGALFAGIVFWPMLGHDFGIGATVMAFLGASLFGVVAGSIAGSSEARESLREAARSLPPTGAMVTCEVADADVVSLCEHLRAHGGHHVQAA
ncbi:MAG: hypothetical protein AAF721_28540 [Myxococcota bacterium]